MDRINTSKEKSSNDKMEIDDLAGSDYYYGSSDEEEEALANKHSLFSNRSTNFVFYVDRYEPVATVGRFFFYEAGKGVRGHCKWTPEVTSSF